MPVLKKNLVLQPDNFRPDNGNSNIVSNTDNLVIGVLRRRLDGCVYAIGGSLMDYSWRVVSAVSTTFTPIASNPEAAGKGEDLRRFLLRGTQANSCHRYPH